VLNARCHPGGGIDPVYDKQTGTLTLRCAVCENPAAEIAVAER